MAVQRSLPAQVIRTLGQDIVSGALPAKTVVTADDLERRFSVSRTVVREAVKVLSEKGLVEARTKLGTVVLERMRWNLLDPEVIDWHYGTEGHAQLMSDLEEVRFVFEPWAARSAAERRTMTNLQRLESAFGLMVEGVDRGLRDTLVIDSDVLFHGELFLATQNEFMASLGHLFAPALRLRNEIAMAHVHDDTFVSLHEAVLQEVRDQKPREAEQAMRKLLAASAHDSASVTQPAPPS